MVVSIETMLSLFGQGDVRRTNNLLAESWNFVAPLGLDGVSISVYHAHFGPGAYRKGFKGPLHRHERLQLEFALSGRFLFSAANGERNLTVGQGVLLLPDTDHSWICRQDGVMMGMLFDVEGIAAKDFLEDMRAKNGEGLHLFDAQKFMSLFDCLAELLIDGSGGVWEHERIGAVLGAWLSGVFEQAWTLDNWRIARESAKGEEEACRRVYEYLVSNFTHPVKLDDVALGSGFSSRHLNRLMQKHHNESIGAALMRIRLEAAKRSILTEPELPIKTIGYNCGFNRPAYFTACFRRHFGRTPMHLRNEEATDQQIILTKRKRKK